MEVDTSQERAPWGVGGAASAPVAAPTVVEFMRPPPVDRPEPRYSRFGRSPLPAMAIAAGASLVAWGVVRWMEEGPYRTDGAPPLRLTRTFWIVLAQGEDVLSHAEEVLPGMRGNRGWVAAAVALVAAVAVLAWIRRVGQNTRNEAQQFGALLPLLALPQWFWLPLVLPDGNPTDRSDTLLRYSFTLLFMLAQVGVARSVFANRLWRAGRLRGEALAALLWVPMLVAYGWLFGAWCYTLVEIGDTGRGRSAWRPTERHVDLAMWTSRLSYLGILALLVVVSIRQHLGLQADRLEDAEFHEELAAEQRRLHAGVPGA